VKIISAEANTREFKQKSPGNPRHREVDFKGEK
jgi:hypothetical protein